MTTTYGRSNRISKLIDNNQVKLKPVSTLDMFLNTNQGSTIQVENVQKPIQHIKEAAVAIVQPAPAQVAAVHQIVEQ